MNIDWELNLKLGDWCIVRMRELCGKGMGNGFRHLVCLLWARSQFEEGGKPLLTVDQVMGIGNLGEGSGSPSVGFTLLSLSHNYRVGRAEPGLRTWCLKQECLSLSRVERVHATESRVERVLVIEQGREPRRGDLNKVTLLTLFT